MSTSLLTLTLCALAACGGGGSGPGGAAATAASTTVAAPGAAMATADAAAAAASDAAAATAGPASAATAAAVSTSANAPVAVQAAVATLDAATDSNGSAVGSARALSEVAGLVMAGVLETPAAAPALAPASGRSFYIDSSIGDDRLDGRAASPAAGSGATSTTGPWRSLARVMQSDLGAGDRLVLACGSRWNETLRLPASGSAASPVTVTAAANCSTRPAIDGGVLLPASAWTQHSGNIYKATLDKLPSQLFASSGLLAEAHHPNRGYLPGEPGTLFAGLAADGNRATAGNKQVSSVLTFGSDLALPAGASLAPGTRVRVRGGAWFIDESRISAVDGNRVTLATPTTYAVAAGWGYYLIGQLWMLDSAGEWHYDAASKQLYVWMPDSGAPASGVSAAVLHAAIDLNDRAHVVVDGVALRRASYGVLMRNSQNVRLRNSVVEDMAEMGADAAVSSGAVIESNSFARIGHDAISGQDDNTVPSTGMVVRNNLVRDSGVLMQGEQVVSLPRRSHGAIRAGMASTVAGNVIINAGYIGIRTGGGSVVEDNFVFGACSVLDDCGGIYVWTDRGVTIRHNTVVHSRGALAGKPAARRFTQAQGIYLDELATDTLIEANTLIDNDHGIHVHVSSNNTLRGNRLFGNRVSQIWLQENSKRSNPNGDLYGNVVEDNQIAASYPGSVALLLQTSFVSTAAFGSFDRNRYYERGASTSVVVSTATTRSAYTLNQWRQSRGVGSTQRVDSNSTSVADKGYTTYAISGGNLVPNSALARDAAGWSSWNQSTPAGQLLRESCTAGICLRYVGGGSSGLVSTPNFSVQQGQWYRLSVDLVTDQDSQPVQIVTRRGGGGSNSYETVSDRNLAVTAGSSWGRYSLIFQATATVIAGSPATGDLGARIDIEGILPGRSVTLANMELMPVSPDTLAQTSGAIVNVGSNTLAATCPFTSSSQAALCAKLVNLGDDLAVTWPLIVAPRSAVIMYAQEPSLRDSDGDGIADTQDRCPDTVPGAAVNASGCSFAQR